MVTSYIYVSPNRKIHKIQENTKYNSKKREQKKRNEKARERNKARETRTETTVKTRKQRRNKGEETKERKDKINENWGYEYAAAREEGRYGVC